MMLSQINRVTRQAGLLSKCLIAGTRNGSLSQNAFAQLDPLRRYKSDAPVGSHVIEKDSGITNVAVLKDSQEKFVASRTLSNFWDFKTLGLNNMPLFQTTMSTEQNRLPNRNQIRYFHAKGSKVRYLDFRYRFRTNHLRSHLLIIRRQKMKKHQKTKWRKKYKSVIAKMRLRREIAKEKTFRIELLTMIKRAEQFDPKEYALKKINEINNRPLEPTREERLEQLKQLIRENRYQVDYIKPKHRRADV